MARLGEGSRRIGWKFAPVLLVALGLASPAGAQGAGGQDAPAAQPEQEKKVDSQGRTDALTLLFYPDTPRDDSWKPRWPPIVTGEWTELGKAERPPASALENQPVLEDAGPAYPWQTPLWEAAGKLLEQQPPEVADAWSGEWHFFPAEEGATLTWLTFPLNQPVPEGQRVVALLRSATEENKALLLGSDSFPFVVRKTARGLLAQAARSVPPGRYAVVAGTAGDDGSFTPHFTASHVVSRVPTDQLRVSKIIIAQSFEDLPEGAAAQGTPFHVGGFEVVPRPDNKVRRGEELTLFYQILGATKADGQTQLDVSYQLFVKPPNNPAGDWVKAGQPVKAQAAGGDTRAWTLPIAPQYPLTDYKVEVDVKDRIGGGQAKQSVIFSVVE